MNGKLQGEVILFPKTIDYYQIELTKLLETEAYGEAIRLLEFLSDCKTDDGRLNEEWNTLLHWLSSEFPEEVRVRDKEVDDGPDGEEELLRRHVSAKASKDKQFANRLLESLSRVSIDKQLLALDQLSYLESDGIGRELRLRLLDPQLHPFVSFKLLQTLAKLGEAGEMTFAKLGEIVTVDIERTPLEADKFPEPLLLISERVRQVSEVDDPTVSDFAKQTWDEFITYIYGTTLYRDMSGMDEQGMDVWAAALHVSVAEAMYGSGRAEELQDRYGITEELLPAWEQAYASLSRYFRDNAGLPV